VFASVDAIRWTGPGPSFPAVCERLGAKSLALRAASMCVGLTRET
jgi:hypothetical protein